jgi:lysine biosynthesis protein LysW
MSVDTSKLMGECPECGSNIRFKKPPVLGQFANCRQCHTVLEVVQRKPITLEWAEIESEWDSDKGSIRSQEQSKKIKRNNPSKDIEF